MNKKWTARTILIIALILIAIGAGYYVSYQRKQLNEWEEYSAFQKAELTQKYNKLFNLYEGQKVRIDNDSLFAQLESEQLKVKHLQEELQTLKASDRKRILQLQKELEQLRAIIKNHIVQIDSLVRLNKQLELENTEVANKCSQATQIISKLNDEKEKLTDRINQAAKLEVINIQVYGLTGKNKLTRKIKKMEKLAFNFTIYKNNTAERGDKILYIRILRPDETILNQNQNYLFSYENKQINYSEKKTIEYTGEEINTTIYWAIEEELLPGTYRVDIFADEQLIGSKVFQLNKS